MPKKHHNRSVKHGLLIMFRWIVLVVMVVSAGWVTWQYFHKKWDGKTRFSLITIDESTVRIETFDPQYKTGHILTFPPNLEVVSVAGRGEWQAQSLAKAGTLAWASDSLANFLGIPYTTNQNMSFWDRLAWNMWKTKINWQTIGLEKTTLLSKETAPDGTEVYTLSPLWEAQAQEWFVNQEIAAASYQLKVTNTTQTPGLGSTAARIVESMGVKVVDVANSEASVTSCIVKSQKSIRKSVFVRELERVFNCEWEETDDSTLELLLGSAYQAMVIGE